jgi:hypothetical protein
MKDVKVFLTVREYTGDSYTEWHTKQPIPYVWLSSAIKGEIKKLLGAKNDRT